MTGEHSYSPFLETARGRREAEGNEGCCFIQVNSDVLTMWLCWCRPEVEDEDDDELEVGQLGEAVSLPAAKKVVPKGSQHPRGKTGLPHCTPDGMGQVCDAFPLASRTWTKNASSE